MSAIFEERETALLAEAEEATLLRRLGIYSRLCGPGWLQGAITLGGGSLAGSLYLGVVFGYEMLWLQPLAMLCGATMLGAVSYVTLSTNERPLDSINKHVSPVLGCAWLFGTVLANVVWILPQFALATAALQQNLLPGIGDGASDWAIGIVLFAFAALIVRYYGKGSRGVQIFESILKAIVGLIVLSFLGVVVTLSLSKLIDWGAVFSGLIPDLSVLSQPTDTYIPYIERTGSFAGWWRERIVADQVDKMITAFATAVGINMTFLLPYSLRKRRWGRRHRGLAIFDLSTGFIIPFVLTTSCVVIAAASQFHGQFGDVLDAEGKPFPAMSESYSKVYSERVEAGRVSAAPDTLATADRELAAMLANRDAFQLASALTPLTGPVVSQKIFGIGVCGMAVSTIIILMLINGFAINQVVSKSGVREFHFIGALIPGVVGVFTPLIWQGDSKLALAIPTSIIGGSLLPIAYLTFFLLINSRKALKENLPSGGTRFAVNLLLSGALGISIFATIWVLKGKGLPGQIGIAVLVLLAGVGILSYLKKEKRIG